MDLIKGADLYKLRRNRKPTAGSFPGTEAEEYALRLIARANRLGLVSLKGTPRLPFRFEQ
ncbi:hypothetical protein [Larkinella soli]|uniref:hypothetical protein n=1 Tax=Larkinella soli TaxID=1770527 RepID=UPI000FFB9D8E|nr:hypothetical protein [Larkinella soli]